MRSRFLFTVSAVVVGAIGAASCATGGTFVGGGGSGAGPGTTTLSTGGATSSSSGTMSSSSGSSSSGSSTSSGGACPDTPCKLTTPQCGCPSGQECTISSYKVACKAGGTTQTGQPCTTQFQCAAGSLCLGVCAKFCDVDADCATQGGICALQLSDGTPTGSIPNVTLCSNACSVTNNSGCTGAGVGCQLGKEQTGQMRFFTFCASAGTGPKGSTCSTSEQCLPTYGCFSSMMCLQYCYVGGAGACGASCSPLQDASMNPIIVNGKTVGVCP